MRRAAIAETHSAVVVFLGERVYKVKKSVDLGFLDFTTREARERACHREVELNRRLAPDVYLGVADVVGEDGAVCDHLVVMRRMPEDRRLATLLDDDRAAGWLRDVARRVAALHASAPTSARHPEIARWATRDAVAGNWQDNLDVLRRFAGTVLPQEEVERVAELSGRYLEGRGPLFEHRIVTGHVRDGHGDLLTDDIFCLDDGPRILDCLEFADRYRYGDVMLDVALLAMDVERRGHPDLAAGFLTDYGEFSGEHHPSTLADHYVAYRAHMRAKVACLQHEQGRGDAADEAGQLHRLTLAHLQRGRVALALVGGLPGTGKSTLARGLSDTLGWALLRSDEVRKDLSGVGHGQHLRAAPGQESYRPELVRAVYAELLDRAQRLVELGVPVVLDASWTSEIEREAAAQVARRTSSDLVQLRCDTSHDVARARLLSRPPGTDPSDATVDVLESMAAAADPWPAASVVRTHEPIDAVLAGARAAVDAQLHALVAN